MMCSQFSFPLLSVVAILKDNWNALHVAVREGHLDLARVLLDRGAAIDAVDEVCNKIFCSKK